MEGRPLMMNKKHISPSSSAAQLPHLHKINSHTISKSKPKIRIIHIFAPEIIKTDAANFRELVQRLTGKPTEDHQIQIRTMSKKRTSSRPPPPPRKMMRTSAGGGGGGQVSLMMTSLRDDDEFNKVGDDAQEFWRGANSESGGGGGFLEGLSHEFDEYGNCSGFTRMQMQEDLNNNNHFSFFLHPTSSSTSQTTTQIQMDASSSSSSYLA